MKHKFFELAKLMSQKSCYKHQIGAVLVYKGRPIGLGFNKPEKTHPKSPHPFETVHAELDAIMGIPKDKLDGAWIYTYREFKDGRPALSRPCKWCLPWLRELGIKRICYTVDDGYASETL